MLALLFSRDTKNNELNDYLFLILCLTIAKTVVSIICFNFKAGFVSYVSASLFAINFVILMLTQMPKDTTSKKFMDELDAISFLVSGFLFSIFVMGVGIMAMPGFRPKSIWEGILYFLNVLSLTSWMNVNSIAKEEIKKLKELNESLQKSL